MSTAADSTLPAAHIRFAETEHSFGKIAEGKKYSCTFSYTNTGTADLVIKSALAGCGCTVPAYSLKPVPPGGTGTIDVMYDTRGKGGWEEQTITLVTNGLPDKVVLTISADIHP